MESSLLEHLITLVMLDGREGENGEGERERGVGDRQREGVR